MRIKFIDEDLPLDFQGLQPPSSMVLIWDASKGALPRHIDGGIQGLREIHVFAGDTVPVGTQVLVIFRYFKLGMAPSSGNKIRPERHDLKNF
jgi:hypothetical protein